MTITANSSTIYRDIAHDYTAAGVSIIPVRCDGLKAPAVPKWEPYRDRFATDEELDRWYGQSGIGLVCGVRSGGLEALDFDERPDETFSAWCELLTPHIRGKLCVCETGGLGYHVLYRCQEICGNAKIAMTEAGKVLVESRGHGGYVVGVGSPLEVHSSGNPYVQVAGQPLPELPTFSIDERKTMWKVAASFDEREDPTAEYVKQRVNQLRPKSSEPVDATTPWGDFCGRASWDDILLPAGWSTHNGAVWTRPGKVSGTSAVVCTAEDGANVLVVYSSNAGPLAPQGMDHKTWNKFTAYAAINHGGNLSTAAKTLRQKGFGK